MCKRRWCPSAPYRHTVISRDRALDVIKTCRDPKVVFPTQDKLGEPLHPKTTRAMAGLYGFDASKNAEIRGSWYRLCLLAGAATSSFLLGVDGDCTFECNMGAVWCIEAAVCSAAKPSWSQPHQACCRMAASACTAVRAVDVQPCHTLRRRHRDLRQRGGVPAGAGPHEVPAPIVQGARRQWRPGQGTGAGQ